MNLPLFSIEFFSKNDLVALNELIHENRDWTRDDLDVFKNIAKKIILHNQKIVNETKKSRNIIYDVAHEYMIHITALYVC